MTKASFDVEVTPEDALAFAELSGDWNPLHTDETYAALTAYKRPILHGAFSAGLVSRLAGMHLPGTKCLLHSMKLRFVAPITPPVSLRVSGEYASSTEAMVRVEATVSDARTSQRYVEAEYSFSRHVTEEGSPSSAPVRKRQGDAMAPILVTGATGGVGSALLEILGERGVGVTHGDSIDFLNWHDLETYFSDGREISGIVHCAWPKRDNCPLVEIETLNEPIDHFIAAPLREAITLSQLILKRGVEGAPLVLVGSTAAIPGRHAWKSPLYSLGKSMIPILSEILAMEFSTSNLRCIGIVFDILDGGMNSGLSPIQWEMNADRSPWGKLPSLKEAAEQILWVLDNPGVLVSGATLTLNGGALP